MARERGVLRSGQRTIVPPLVRRREFKERFFMPRGYSLSFRVREIPTRKVQIQDYRFHAIVRSVVSVISGFSSCAI